MPQSRADCVSSVWRDGVFENKVVFCTGGAGSICSVQVRACVALGANAYIVGRNKEKTEMVAADIATVRLGSTVLGLGNIDVRNPKKMEEAVEECVKRLGGIDFVIAGAAANFLTPISQLSINAFKTIVDIDLIGSYITLKATLPHLLKSAETHKVDGKTASNGTGGRIVFVSSTSHYTSRPFQAHACAAKAGVTALSDCVALEYGPLGMTSNIIAPGPIGGTEGMERLMRPEDKAEAIRNIPLQRLGSVKDIADATVYVFSETGSFVNGAHIDVDGAAWRVKASNPGSALNYPDFLLGGETVTGVKGAKAKI